MKDRKPIFNTIANWAVQRPNDCAIIYGEHSLNYQQLDRQSDLLARYLLVRHAVYSGGRIAVLLDPGVMMPVVLLAIMKAGCGYIPLSNFLPEEKIRQIMTDAGACLLLTSTAALNKMAMIQQIEPVLLLEDVCYADLPKEIELPQVNDTDIAYLLYTSGSTGTPKGVAVEHGNLSYYLAWFNRELWPETQAILPLTSTLSFAAAVTQLYAPLLRGDTVHILPANVFRQPELLLAWYAQHPAGALYCVPTLWDGLLRYHCRNSSIGRLPATVLLSGEPVSFDLQERTFAHCPQITLYNLYGPTEATANATFARLQQGKAVTLGRALSGSRVTVVDATAIPVNAAEAGEICILGPGVARGYLNRDALTQQRFFSDSLDGVSLRGYRTGDRGAFNTDGELVFLGRIDDEIKIDGVRIAVEEIESALRKDGRIRHALVRKRVAGAHTVRLVAWLVTAGAVEISPSEIHSALRAILPTTLIPSHFVFVETLPVLPNGKIDIQRLPPPGRQRPALSTAFRCAANALEQELIDIFEETLGVCDLGADDNFFDLGGGSLQVMQARQLMRRNLFSNIDYALFASNATPHLLSLIAPYYIFYAEVSASCNAGQSPSLSGEQRWFLTLDKISPTPGAYHIAFRIMFNGPLDPAAVAWCVQRIVENNPQLRSRFTLDDMTCCEGAYPAASLKIARQPCAADVYAAGDIDDSRLLATAKLSPLDPERTPLIAFRLLALGQNRHLLLVQVHHALFDHDAIGLFFRQFVAYAHAFRAGDRDFVLRSGAGYQRYCQWQQHPAQQARYQQDRAFWQKTFARYVQAGADASAFSPQETMQGHNVHCLLPETLTSALRHFARGHQTTVFVCLLTAFNQLLNMFTCYRHVPIAIPVSNRMQYDDNQLLGCFVNTVTWYDTYCRDENNATRLERCRQIIYDAFEHQLLPYAELHADIRACGWHRLLYTPVGFNYLTAMPDPVTINNLEVSVRPVENAAARMDLTLIIHDEATLRLGFNYHAAAFNHREVARLADAYLNIIKMLIGH